jgi:predicted RNA binding protein YcfA (HicA-like mRNA interferase family)
MLKTEPRTDKTVKFGGSPAGLGYLIRYQIIACNRIAGTMKEHEKLLNRIISGTSDAKIWFHGMCSILRSLGFQERIIRGNHHIFTKEGVEEILNLQPKTETKVKPYQVKQIRQVVLRYRLGGSKKSDQ